jgi:asparagine synthase (glutamine-hydrolysing)
MCGILGLVNFDNYQIIDEKKFGDALQTMAHRGPDAHITERLDERTMFGHLRLSIIDLGNESNQPFTLLNRYCMVYNGEIFNYLELRKELVALGATFRTNGDTEVLLHAYVYWGEECVNHFNGMWAFAIYDKLDRTLFCSRDRFGQKPFNYCLFKGSFIFSSEIKAILRYFKSLATPNYTMIANYCRTSVGAQHEESWFDSIVRLQPGFNLTMSNGTIKLRRYWHYPTEVNRNLNPSLVIEQYKYLFEDAVNLRMRSDVPLGLTLSGGIDSTSIACVMHSIDTKQHNCFTASFDENTYSSADHSIYTDKSLCFDESAIARDVSEMLDWKYHAVKVRSDQFVQSLQKVIFHLESGNSSPAVLPVMQLFECVSNYVKVVLEGQGADEMLGGYIISVIWPHIIGLLQQGKLKEASAELSGYLDGNTLSYSIKMALRNLSNSLPSLVSIYQKMNGVDAVFGPLLSNRMRLKDYPDIRGEGLKDPLSSTLLRQHSGGLVNLLHYGDALSMAYGVENRMPFLDHRLVEFSWTLPPQFKIKHGLGKSIHRQAMQGIVPSHILENRSKIGFLTPISAQFMSNSNVDSSALEILTSHRFNQRSLFSRAGLNSMLKSHQSGKRDHGNILFRILSVELWFREFIDYPSDRSYQ